MTTLREITSDMNADEKLEIVLRAVRVYFEKFEEKEDLDLPLYTTPRKIMRMAKVHGRQFRKYQGVFQKGPHPGLRSHMWSL